MSRRPKLAAVAAENHAAIPSETAPKSTLTLRDRMAKAPRKTEAANPLANIGKLPKEKPAKVRVRPVALKRKARDERPAFEMPVLQFDADGAATNYHMQASAIARYVIANGMWPSIPPFHTHNAFTFGISRVPRAVASTLRLSPYATWQDVHDRLKDILGRNLPAEKITAALALPATTEDGKAVGWDVVIASTGAKPRRAQRPNMG